MTLKLAEKFMLGFGADTLLSLVELWAALLFCVAFNRRKKGRADKQVARR